jgi:ABC-type glutathione transport system ATPase component
LCDTFLPLPGKDDGYTTVQLIGTTGAGKTTLVRQLLGTHPKRERFPSTSAAKTTVSDFEVILASGPFRAVVSFLPRERVRQYIMECVIAAVAARVEGTSEDESYSAAHGTQ